MARPIYEMLTKGQTVRINGKLGSYQVTKVLKETVFQASTVGTSTSVLVKTESHSWSGNLERSVTGTSMRCVLAHFLAARALLGPGNQDAHAESLPREVNQAAWAMGKIIQLVGPLERNEDLKYKLEFDLAEVFVKRGIIQIKTLEEELAKVNAPADCIDFIQYLLTLDHKKRPTAEEALQHPWLQNSE